MSLLVRGPMTCGERTRHIVKALTDAYPKVECALRHDDALQLLAATILSAQCTDVRVNQVTPELFRRCPTARHYAAAKQSTLESLIRSTGFFRNKARSLKGMGRTLVERFGGEVPGTMDELLLIPGVARKTANVVRGTWFGKAAGVVVDTHVTRIASRLALTSHADPRKIELDLIRLLPRQEWISFSHRMIWHGRRICSARRPKCMDCSLREWCPTATLA